MDEIKEENEMLVDIVEENGKIVLLAAKQGVQSEIPQQLIDNVIEQTALEEVYNNVEEEILAEAYEMYSGTEEIIVGEVALLLNTLITNLRLNGFTIVRKDI